MHRAEARALSVGIAGVQIAHLKRMGEAEVVAHLVEPTDAVQMDPLVVDHDDVLRHVVEIDREGADSADLSVEQGVQHVHVDLVRAIGVLPRVRLRLVLEGHELGIGVDLEEPIGALDLDDLRHPQPPGGLVPRQRVVGQHDGGLDLRVRRVTAVRPASLRVKDVLH